MGWRRLLIEHQVPGINSKFRHQELATCGWPAVAHSCKVFGGRRGGRRQRAALQTGGTEGVSLALFFFFFFSVGGEKTASRRSVCTDQKWRRDTPSSARPARASKGGVGRRAAARRSGRAGAPALTRPADWGEPCAGRMMLLRGPRPWRPQRPPTLSIPARAGPRPPTPKVRQRAQGQRPARRGRWLEKFSGDT